ncbi:MAG: Uma2 family endonuclease [Pirellulales bacterium]
MASIVPRTGQYTFDDFLVLINPDEKADLLDGVIYMASPESTDDNELVAWLSTLMVGFADELELGKVFVTRVAFRITEKRGPEPDVAFVAKRRLRLVQRGFVNGPPDIAVEIVSPDSVERDYVTKRQVYEKAGVREYWIIDPGKQAAAFLRRQRGKFQPMVLNGSIVESKVLPGFRFDVRWLWSKRRPSPFRVLRELLDQSR